MNNQEAIKQLENLKEHCCSMESSEFDVWSRDVEALDFAIRALKKFEFFSIEPSEMRYITCNESMSLACPQLIFLTKGAKTELNEKTCGEEWFPYCNIADYHAPTGPEDKQHSGLLEE